MEMNLQSTQIALMYQSLFSGSFNAIEKEIKNKYPQAKANLLSLPVPLDQLPPELPILTVTLENGEAKMRITFAKNRTDLFFDYGEVKEDVLDYFLNLIVSLKLTIGRLGYVQKRTYTKIDYDLIRRKFHIGNDLIEDNEDIREATYKINKATVLKGNKNHICNNIVGLTLGKVNGNLALLLERDVNTSQEDENLSLQAKDEIAGLINLLAAEAKDTVLI